MVVEVIAPPRKARWPLTVWRFVALALRPEALGADAARLATLSRGRLSVATVSRFLANHRIAELVTAARRRAQAAVLLPVDEAMLREGQAGNARAAELAYERVAGWRSAAPGSAVVAGGRPRRILVIEVEPEPAALPAPKTVDAAVVSSAAA